MEPALGWEGTVLYLDRLQILGLKAAARWDCTRHAVPNLPPNPPKPPAWTDQQAGHALTGLGARCGMPVGKRTALWLLLLLLLHLRCCSCADVTNWVKKAEERAKLQNDDLQREKGASQGSEAWAGDFSQPLSGSRPGGVNGSVDGGDDDDDDDGEEDGEEGAAEFDHTDEWFYFKGLDINKDGALDSKEFEHHLELGSDGGQLERRDDYLMGFMVGREWAELHEDGDSHKEAFNGVDFNGDGKITWKEWVGEIYHDVPQRPSFVDGEIGKDVADEGMFSEYDADKNGYLNYDELAKFVATWVNREDVDEDYAGNQPDEEHTAEGHVGQTYVMLFEFDSDSDQMVSLEEWKQGFAKEAHGPPPGSVLLQHV